MKDKKFNKLIQSIENNTFVGNKLKIDGSSFEEGQKSEDALDDNKAIILAEALKKNSNIIEVDLISNNIGDIGAIALSTVTTIEYLSLYNNNLMIKGVTALAKSNIKALELMEVGITDNQEKINFFDESRATDLEIQEMIEAFINNKTIEYLGLNNCYLHTEGDNEIIAQLINKNNTIKRLSLDSNKLGDEALKYIGNNTTLESLRLYGNEITDLGAKYISQNCSLKKIILDRDDILTEVGIKFLSLHPTLEVIGLNRGTYNIKELEENFSFVSNETVLSGNSDEVGNDLL
jgi:hypothetical protein